MVLTVVVLIFGEVTPKALPRMLNSSHRSCAGAQPADAGVTPLTWLFMPVERFLGALCSQHRGGHHH